MVIEVDGFAGPTPSFGFSDGTPTVFPGVVDVSTPTFVEEVSNPVKSLVSGPNCFVVVVLVSASLTVLSLPGISSDAG